ncbi:hypothetical protein KAU32_04185 [bacterium]|nr:hypothetical protein [bacterium]
MVASIILTWLRKDVFFIIGIICLLIAVALIVIGSIKAIKGVMKKDDDGESRC